MSSARFGKRRGGRRGIYGAIRHGRKRHGAKCPGCKSDYVSQHYTDSQPTCGQCGRPFQPGEIKP
jgi:hypothetical protein